MIGVPDEHDTLTQFEHGPYSNNAQQHDMPSMPIQTTELLAEGPSYLQ